MSIHISYLPIYLLSIYIYLSVYQSIYSYNFLSIYPHEYVCLSISLFCSPVRGLGSLAFSICTVYMYVIYVHICMCVNIFAWSNQTGCEKMLYWRKISFNNILGKASRHLSKDFQKLWSLARKEWWNGLWQYAAKEFGKGRN